MKRPLLIAGLIVASSSLALAGWKEVPVEIKSPAKLSTQPGERVLVAKVRAPEHERYDLGMEITRWLRREIARSTPLVALDVPPPDLPEQRTEVMAVNDQFFHRLGDQYKAQWVVAAVADMKIEDRSGFVTKDVESPVTGQTVRTSSYVELKGYRLQIQIFFLRGDNGALIYRDTWSEERVVETEGTEDLETLFQLLEQMKDDLSAVLNPVRTQSPRNIWVE